MTDKALNHLHPPSALDTQVSMGQDTALARAGLEEAPTSKGRSFPGHWGEKARREQGCRAGRSGKRNPRSPHAACHLLAFPTEHLVMLLPPSSLKRSAFNCQRQGKTSKGAELCIDEEQTLDGTSRSLRSGSKDMDPLKTSWLSPLPSLRLFACLQTDVHKFCPQLP